MHYASTKACRAWFTLLNPSCGHMKKLSLFNIQGYSLATTKMASLADMYNYAEKQVYQLSKKSGS